jgi:hypothetical protein
MTSGLINIVAYGGQDLFLTGNPEITHFKAVYRRHTNFSVQSYKLNFDETINFGKEIHIEIPRIGDLLSKTYLELILPEVAIRRVYKTLYQDDFINPINLEYQEALNNVTIVAKYMNLNMEAYRQANEEYSSINSIDESIETMKELILTQFNLSSVGTSVPDADVINKIIQDFKKLIASAFDYSMIGLDFIASTVSDTITKNDFYLLIKSAIDYSYTVMHHYVSKYVELGEQKKDIESLYYKFAWVDRIGHSIIDYIDVFIGGEKIDRHYGLWLDIWYELTGKKTQETTYMKMIGNVSELTNYDRSTKPSYKLLIPLQFWFCRHNGLAIPLVALEYNKVSFTIKLREFAEVAYIEKENLKYFKEKPDLKILYEDLGLKLDGNLVCDYVFLDGPERRKFAQSGHEYLIEQNQYYFDMNINKELFFAKIDFNHPVKEIIWVLQKNNRLINETNDKKIRWTNYGVNEDGSKNPIRQAKLDFNSYERVIPLDGNYFNYVQPYKHHSNTPADGINMYSFSLYPEEIQPSGSCNFTRLSNVLLTLLIDPSMIEPVIEPIDNNSSNITSSSSISYMNSSSSGGSISSIADPSIRLWIFGINYNVLRIFGGFGALAFS